MIELVIEKQYYAKDVTKYVCWNPSKLVVISASFNFDGAIKQAGEYMMEHYPHHNHYLLTIKDVTDVKESV